VVVGSEASRSFPGMKEQADTTTLKKITSVISLPAMLLLLYFGCFIICGI
jgi:hypothetical protein